MFSPYEVVAIVHSKRRAVVVSGFAAGLVTSAIPPTLLLANALIMAGWLLAKGSSLAEIAHNALFLNCLTLAGTYYVKGHAYILAFCAYCSLQAVLTRYFLKRGKSREIKIWTPGGLGMGEVTVGDDVLLPIVLFPILVSLISIDLAKLLAMAGGLLFLSGVFVYVVWALSFEWLMTTFSAASPTVLLNICLNEALRYHDGLSACRIGATVSPSGSLALLTGFVSSKDQISEARFAALRVRGIEDADVSGLQVDPPEGHMPCDRVPSVANPVVARA